jgi:hypothetical protein
MLDITGAAIGVACVDLASGRGIRTRDLARQANPSKRETCLRGVIHD